MKEISKKLPKILLVIYMLLFIVLAFNPFERVTWFIENLPIIAIVFLLVLSYKKYKFSHLSYILIFMGVIWHTIGAFYTFEHVPFDFINDLFGFDRNQYDRFGHFIAGLYAVPLAEYVYKKKIINSFKYALIFGLFAIGFIAAFYEIIEFAYAVIFGGESAEFFLGAQGDFWDAQWDMSMNISGAVISLGIYKMLYIKIRKENKYT